MSLMLHRIGLLSPPVGSPAASVPDAFVVEDWSVAPGDAKADVMIHALPDGGGAAITDIEYRLDGGSWVSSVGTSSFTISGLTNDQEYDVELRAVNSVGAGAASDTKQVTPVAEEPSGPDLTIGLISFWELEEESGARADSHGSNDLTDVNTVGQATGIVGNAANIIRANGERLTHADNDDLGYGGDFSVAAWLYFNSFTNSYLISKDAATFANLEWRIQQVNSGGNKLNFEVATASTGTSVLHSTVLSTGTWYFVVATYTASTRGMTLSLDAGTRGTNTHSGEIARKISAEFVLGGRTGASGLDGRMDQVGFWKRALTTDEEAWLYNSGNGRTYAEIAASGA